MATAGDEAQVPSRSLVIKDAWRRADPALEADALVFWTRQELLPAQVSARERLDDLCSVAYRAGEVVAVATATLRYWPVLHARLAMFRCAIAPDHRQGAAVSQLAEASRLRLLAWARENPQEKIKGMGAVTTTPGLDGMKRTPVWRYRGLRLVLVGFTDRGDPFRVAWFPGVKVEKPGQGFGPSGD